MSEEKYDLNKMLEEIKEDERVNGSKKKAVSQEEIQRMLLERQRSRRGKHDQES